MIDVIEHVVKFLVMIILPLAIILWHIIGCRFKDLDEKIIKYKDKINQLEKIKKD